MTEQILIYAAVWFSIGLLACAVLTWWDWRYENRPVTLGDAIAIILFSLLGPLMFIPVVIEGLKGVPLDLVIIKKRNS